MRLVLQRVKSASVTTVDNAEVSRISSGIMCLVGIHENDTEADLNYCAKKLLTCKLWDNENEKPWRKSVVQMEKEILCVSQFTLYGTVGKKSIPDYKYSMKSAPAKEFYDQFLAKLRTDYPLNKIQDGIFGSMMDVALVNDGPVTLVIDSPASHSPPTDTTVEEE